MVTHLVQLRLAKKNTHFDPDLLNSDREVLHKLVDELLIRKKCSLISTQLIAWKMWCLPFVGHAKYSAYDTNCIGLAGLVDADKVEAFEAK
jgi:hypothetical protein